MADEFVPRRLRLARLFLGLTQAELAARLDVNQSWVGQVESGTKPVSGDRMLAIAEVSGFHPGFFHTPIHHEFTDDNCHFRTRKSPASVRNQAMATGTLFSAVVAHLEEQIDFPDDIVPSFSVSAATSIEDVAARCRTAWGLPLDRPIGNITRVAENAGVLVTRCASNDKVDAFSCGAGPRKLIVVNGARGASRTRFDIAHELGHLVMHAGLKTGDDATEEEADRFASAFLLPARGFAHEFPQGRIDWTAMLALKRRWSVSLQALIMRAHELDRIAALQKTSAYKYIAWNGWRKNEPGEPPMEAPEAVRNAFVALEDDGCPVAAAARAVHTTEEVVLEIIGRVYEPKQVEPPPRTPGGGDVISFADARRRLAPAPPPPRRSARRG
jgi:Zn-dependent peptidase ImmA (M78 family)/transcriptional regulator with XRE-family HTH domain